MRLVDADKLIEICRKGWKLFGREDEKLKHWIDEDDIRNQPTVEAIPIEWLKKQIEEWKNWGPEGLSDDEWEYGTCLETLLENWEKENE